MEEGKTVQRRVREDGLYRFTSMYKEKGGMEGGKAKEENEKMEEEPVE